MSQSVCSTYQTNTGRESLTNSNSRLGSRMSNIRFATQQLLTCKIITFAFPCNCAREEESTDDLFVALAFVDLLSCVFLGEIFLNPPVVLQIDTGMTTFASPETTFKFTAG